jgi:hypothetical protein
MKERKLITIRLDLLDVRMTYGPPAQPASRSDVGSRL